MYEIIYLLDDEKDNEKLVSLLGAERFSTLDNYGFNMASCAVFPGTLQLETSIETLHQSLVSQLKEKDLTTIIVSGDLVVDGRLDNTSNVIVLGTTHCHSFVDHGDGCFYTKEMKARDFASWRCAGADFIESLAVPLSFEWGTPIIKHYSEPTTVVVGDRSSYEGPAVTAIKTTDLPSRLHSDLLLEFAEDVDDEDLHCELSDQIDELADWIETRLNSGKPVLSQ